MKAKHTIHSEWLSLIETSGPFLTLSMLEQVFPQGLETVETSTRQQLRAAYEEWREAVDQNDDLLPELHKEWVRLVLSVLLEFDTDSLVPASELHDAIPKVKSHDNSAAFSPDLLIISPTSREHRVFIAIVHPDTDLASVKLQDGWPLSLQERMTLLCRTYNIRLGVLTDGERWMLVNAPIGSTSSQATWYSRLWFQEPITLKAFQSLLGVRRCFGPSQDTLESLLDESLKHNEEVTEILGDQVKRAVEVLVQCLDKADQDRNRELLQDIQPSELYEAGLTVMMRLVFLLCAEERGLLLLGDPVYDSCYAITTLRGQLAEEADNHGPEVLDRRYDAWARMLALFRAVYGGIEHENLRMPALGGSLFDPDRFPFLEGRAKGTNWRESLSIPLPIDNRTVLLLLNSLQVLEQSGGALLLSYRTLDVEQIGHIYEGLLEYKVDRVPDVTIGLMGSQKAKNPYVRLTELESASQVSKTSLVSLVKNVTLRSESAIAKGIAKPADEAMISRIQGVCGGGTDLTERIRPFANLIRTDAWDEPIIYLENSFMVTLGADRHETGTHYTPKSLTESIVSIALEPIVYDGPTEGKNVEEWKLKSPGEILDLKICDPAMGSGAFLVQTCRYLGEKLVEAWQTEEKSGKVVTVDGDVLEHLEDAEPLPSQMDERLTIARRLIAERCLYGVDINPLAVELAKLSIWLVTLAKGYPLGFLDHNFCCGDSLSGIYSIDQLIQFRMKPRSEYDQINFFGSMLESTIQKVVELRLRIKALSIRDIHDIDRMNSLHLESRSILQFVELAADQLVSVAMLNNTSTDKLNSLLDTSLSQLHDVFNVNGNACILTTLANPKSGKKTIDPLHWPLRYPEVFMMGGFDVVLGNPPFISYYSRQSLSKESDNAKNLARFYDFSYVESAGKRYNSAMFFWERGVNIARTGGMIGFLNDMNFLENSFTPIREWIVKNHDPVELVTGIKAFVGVASGQVFFLMRRGCRNCNQLIVLDGFCDSNKINVPIKYINASNQFSFQDTTSKELFEGIPLGELLDISVGIVFSGSTDSFLCSGQRNIFCYPYMTGGNLKYKFENPLPVTHFVDFTKDLLLKVNSEFSKQNKKNVAVLGDYKRFKKEKIIIRQSSDAIVATVDNTGLAFPLNYFCANLKDTSAVDLFYIMGILNSSIMTKIAQETGVIRRGQGKQPQIRKSGLVTLPIPIPGDMNLINLVSDLSLTIWKSFNARQSNETLLDELDRLSEQCFTLHNS